MQNQNGIACTCSGTAELSDAGINRKARQSIVKPYSSQTQEP